MLDRLVQLVGQDPRVSEALALQQPPSVFLPLVERALAAAYEIYGEAVEQLSAADVQV